MGAAIVLLGWTTGLRQVAYSATLGLAVVAFLPFVLGLLAIGIALCVFVLKTGFVGLFLASEAVDVVSPVAGSIVEATAPGYYRWLVRVRHPVALGAAAGTLLGAVLLFGLIALLVLPGESRTTLTLARAANRLNELQTLGRLPEPDSAGHLSMQSLDPSGTQPGDVLRDGFGRPIRYETEGSSILKRYRLVSHGFDGRAGTSDDLRLRGHTLAARAAGAVGSALFRLAAAGETNPRMRDRLRAIAELRDNR